MNKKFLDELQMKELVETQVNSWELKLKHKGLCQSTIDRKINNIALFYYYMIQARLHSKNNKLKVDRMNDLLFEFIRDGNYSFDNVDNEGTYEYRKQIYSNIREGINYIYEDYFKDREEVIKLLTEEQKDVLKEVSINKWFRVDGLFRNDESVNENIQVRLIQELGIKVYFDKENKPYVLSHELAELINVEPKHIREKIKKLNKYLDGRNFDYPIKHSNFNTLDDTYINSQNKKHVTSRMYKDMLIFYLMDLTAQGNKKDDLMEFKIRYIDAFNYIEEEYKRLLEENARLKESFLNMYNQIRKRNRELLIVDHNKKCKKAS